MYSGDTSQHLYHIWRHFIQHSRSCLYDVTHKLYVSHTDIFSTCGAILHDMVCTVRVTWPTKHVINILTPHAIFPTHIPANRESDRMMSAGTVISSGRDLSVSNTGIIVCKRCVFGILLTPESVFTLVS